MELRKLLEGVEIRKITGETLKEIEGIAYHSKQMGKGFLFAAIRGMEVDGHQFIGEAIERGAEAVVLEEEIKIPVGAGLALPRRAQQERPTHVTMISVPNSRQALAKDFLKLLWRPLFSDQTHWYYRNQWKDHHHLSLRVHF